MDKLSVHPQNGCRDKSGEVKMIKMKLMMDKQFICTNSMVKNKNYCYGKKIQ